MIVAVVGSRKFGHLHWVREYVNRMPEPEDTLITDHPKLRKATWI